MVTHHDELPGEYLHAPEKTLPGMISAGGFPFRDGTSVCGRLAPLLGNNSRRLGLAYFLMFVFPRSTPTLYYGEEAGLGNDPAHADREAARRKKILASLGSADGGENAAYDARDVHRQVISPQVLEEEARTEDTVAAGFRNLSALRLIFAVVRSHILPVR